MFFDFKKMYHVFAF